MSNTKHTPGPWHVIPKGRPFSGDIADNTGKLVAQAFLSEHQANARLIAAAPAMLEALQEMMKADDAIQDNIGTLADQAMQRIAALDLAQAAIDLATNNNAH